MSSWKRKPVVNKVASLWCGFPWIEAYFHNYKFSLTATGLNVADKLKALYYLLCYVAKAWLLISSNLLRTTSWRTFSNILERNSEKRNSKYLELKCVSMNIILSVLKRKLAKIMQILFVFSAGERSEQFKVLDFIHIDWNNFRFFLSEVILSSIPQSYSYHQFDAGAVEWNWWHRRILAQPKGVYVINF